MKVKQQISYYQQGGPMDQPSDPAAQDATMQENDGAMAPESGGQDEMMQQLQQIASQLLDSLMQQIGDPQAVAAILQMALEMLQQGSAEQQQPQFQRIGGKIQRIR